MNGKDSIEALHNTVKRHWHQPVVFLRTKDCCDSRVAEEPGVAPKPEVLTSECSLAHAAASVAQVEPVRGRPSDNRQDDNRQVDTHAEEIS